MAYSDLLEIASEKKHVSHIVDCQFLQMLECFCVLVPSTKVRECVVFLGFDFVIIK